MSRNYQGISSQAYLFAYFDDGLSRGNALALHKPEALKNNTSLQTKYLEKLEITR